MKHRLLIALAPLSSCILALSSASGAVFTSGHGDLGIAYDAGEFDLHVHLHEFAVVDGVPVGPAEAEYAPGDLYINVPGPSVNRPGSATFAPIGVSAGQPFWFLPAVEDIDKPFFGAGAEELDPGDWTGPISLKLTGVAGSGVTAGGFVSLWETDLFGDKTFFWSSVDGLTGADLLPVLAGSHAHYNFAFTQPGLYDLTVEASGLHDGDGLITSSATYQFAVVTAVPEPTTGFWGLVALGLAGVRRFRTRRGVAQPR